MSEHEPNPRQMLSEEELRLAIEKELERSMHEELRRISEKKMQEKSTSEYELPPAPDFRPSGQNQRFGSSSRNPLDSLAAPPRKRMSAAKWFLNTGIYFLVFVVVLAGLCLFFLLFQSPNDGLPGTAPIGSGSVSGSNTDGLHGNSSVIDTPSENDSSASSDHGTSENLPVDFPSGGYSSKDVALSLSKNVEETRSDSGIPIFTVTINTPTLQYSTNPAAEAVINTYMRDRFSFYQSEGAREAAEYADHYTDGATAGSYEVLSSILATKDEILTVTVTVNSLRGASPLTTVDCYNFNARTGALLSLEEAVSDLPRLAELAIFYVDKSLVWEEIYEQVIRTYLCDTWYPSAEGIVLVYQQYSIGSGASGIIEALVPYSELEGILCSALARD